METAGSYRAFEALNHAFMSATLRLTRAAFGAVQRASPRLAAVWAERIFCTPPRRPISERMAAWLRDGERFTVSVGGRRVAAWSWGTGGAVVLLVHGWGSRGARFIDLGNTLLGHGYRVVTFDAPGHGESTGRLSSGPEFARAALAVASAVGPVSYVVGHSLGGFAAALAMTSGVRFLSPLRPTRTAIARSSRRCLASRHVSLHRCAAGWSGGWAFHGTT